MRLPRLTQPLPDQHQGHLPLPPRTCSDRHIPARNAGTDARPRYTETTRDACTDRWRRDHPAHPPLERGCQPHVWDPCTNSLLQCHSLFRSKFSLPGKSHAWEQSSLGGDITQRFTSNLQYFHIFAIGVAVECGKSVFFDQFTVLFCTVPFVDMEIVVSERCLCRLSFHIPVPGHFCHN